MDSTIEKGVMRVGEGSVCISAKRGGGGGGGGTTHKLSWTFCEVSSVVAFFIFQVLVTWDFRIVLWTLFILTQLWRKKPEVGVSQKFGKFYANLSFFIDLYQLYIYSKCRWHWLMLVSPWCHNLWLPYAPLTMSILSLLCSLCTHCQLSV